MNPPLTDDIEYYCDSDGLDEYLDELDDINRDDRNPTYDCIEYANFYEESHSQWDYYEEDELTEEGV